MMVTNRKKAGRRSAIEAELTKANILDVAVKILSENNSERYSLREVSKKANVSHSLVRHHFGSKKKLHQSVIIQIRKRIEQFAKELINNIDDELPPNEKLYLFSISLHAYMLSRKESLRIIDLASIEEQSDGLLRYLDAIEPVKDYIAEFNRENLDDSVDLVEQQWVLISSVYSAINLEKFMGLIYEKYNKAIQKHWMIYNYHVAKVYKVSKDLYNEHNDIIDLLEEMGANYQPI